MTRSQLPRPRPANEVAEAFVASIGCPFCRWGTAASAPSYREAQALVTEGLVAHVAAHCAGARKAA